MTEMHRLLKRQIKKYFGDKFDSIVLPPSVYGVIEAVNNAYYDFEKDRALMERSIEISSREYAESIDKVNKLQMQLIHQEKMAGIGQLSAGIAHEINNPLGFVQSNIETMKKYSMKLQGLFDIMSCAMDEMGKGDFEEAGRKCSILKEYIKVQKINLVYADLADIIDESIAGVSRIEKIVKSLLGFARKGLSQERVEYDINKGIRDTVTIATNEIKYYADVEENLESIPVIMAVDGEINQVLLNLIVNAAHAIRDKGAKGTITIHSYRNDDYACCAITDNGVGIPDANLSRIFEPFFSTKPVGSGTGLGLSIVHDIVVNKHGGRVDVESEVGKGTTFTVTLPINPPVSS